MTKAVILAGGFGTRLSEETALKPKPMVEVGDKPILWHIMKTYSSYGIDEFIICCGYKSYVIKEYFANYYLHHSDVTFDLSKNQMEVHRSNSDKWKVTLVDTGLETQTGGRLKRIYDYIKNEPYFHFTYGDGVCNIDLNKLLHLHQQEKRLATVSAVLPPGRFGALDIQDNRVVEFKEKPRGDGAMVNGGYFILTPAVVSEYIESDATIWEQEPMRNLCVNNQLSVYKHDGFWQSMDTLRDQRLLQSLWDANNAPWKIWND